MVAAGREMCYNVKEKLSVNDKRKGTNPLSMDYSVSLDRIIREFSLESIVCDAPERVFVTTADVNRPATQLGGFFDYYDNKRIQIVGNVETAFLMQFDYETRAKSYQTFFATHPVAVIVARSLDIPPEMKAAAVANDVPLLRTSRSTSEFSAALVAYLNVELAPRQTVHGVLLDVYGEGILLLGESGVGKSETAIELVKRGHRIIADDAVEIRRVSDKTLVGQAPENIRHYVELRGIGIINVRRIFGMGAVKETERLDLVIRIEPWEEGKAYDRMGIEDKTTNLLGIDLPYVEIPINPGRNLAIIIEVAAMNNRQKALGYNAANELINKLGLDSYQ